MADWLVGRFCSCIVAGLLESPLDVAAPEAMLYRFGISGHSPDGPSILLGIAPGCASGIVPGENPSDEDSDGLTSHKELKSIGNGVSPLPEVRSPIMRDKSSKEPNGN